MLAPSPDEVGSLCHRGIINERPYDSDSAPGIFRLAISIPRWHITVMLIRDHFGSDGALVEALQISQPYANKLRNGKRRPSRDLALRLEAITGVPAGEWLRVSEIATPSTEAA